MTVMTCCRPFLSFFLLLLFVCSLFSLPTGLISFLFVLFSSAKQQLFSLHCFFCAASVFFFVVYCPCNGNLFLLSTYGALLAIAVFPFLSFVLLCFLFLFFFVFPFFSCSILSALLSCVLVLGTPALHLLYLDELRLPGLLCFTIVCDNRIIISLG